MAFTLQVPSALARTEFYAKPASTAFAIDTLVAPNKDNTSNTFVAATSSTTVNLGVLQKAVASTDSDYASETKVPVLVDECGIWRVTCSVAHPVDINDEQGYIDLTDAADANAAASTVDALFVVNFVSSSSTDVTKNLLDVKIVRWAGLEPPAIV